MGTNRCSVGLYFIEHFMADIGESEPFHRYETKITKWNPNEPAKRLKKRRLYHRCDNLKYHIIIRKVY
jgi:hypothetical protein